MWRKIDFGIHTSTPVGSTPVFSPRNDCTPIFYRLGAKHRRKHVASTIYVSNFPLYSLGGLSAVHNIDEQAWFFALTLLFARYYCAMVGASRRKPCACFLGHVLIRLAATALKIAVFVARFSISPLDADGYQTKMRVSAMLADRSAPFKGLDRVVWWGNEWVPLP